MNLGQLIIDCIKKIKTDNNSSLNLSSIEDYKTDRDYSKYFNNVIPSINDGIRRLVAAEKIPYQTLQISITQSTTEISKSQLQGANIYRIKSILFEDADGVLVPVSYFQLADVYKLGSVYSSGKFIILYAPTVRLLTEDDEYSLDLTTLGITDLVCGFLTYFVKAELYEKVEPEEAAKWRNYAEQYKSALDQEVTLPTQQKVRQVVRLD